MDLSRQRQAQTIMSAQKVKEKVLRQMQTFDHRSSYASSFGQPPATQLGSYSMVPKRQD